LVAGAGLFGREHLDRLAKRADVQVAAVADPSREALDAVRTRSTAAELFGNAAEMLERVQADGVIVATPSATHFDLTEQALSRGMAVLLEKPVASGLDEAQCLVEAAKRSGKLVLPGHVLRFSKDHQRVAEIIASGAIGRPLYINSRRYRDESHAIRYSDADPILMTMIHDIDLALWFAGAPFRSAWAHRQPSAGFRSMTAATCITQNGIICNLRTAWTFGSGDEPPDRLEIVGDRGSVELEPGRSFVQFAGGSKREIPLGAEDDALANEQTHFIECLRDPSHKPALTLEDAFHGLRLAGALFKSIETGRCIELGQ
jgi:predicted dehydrogenase